MAADPTSVRQAADEDARVVARLLDDFNTEFGDPTPGVEFLAERFRELRRRDELAVLLAGEPPLGIAVLRLRPALWSEGLNAYLEELYVAPDRRGEGFGRELLEATMALARERGAVRIELGTSVDDRSARALYESSGFTNREGEPDGPSMLFYEREL